MRYDRIPPRPFHGRGFLRNFYDFTEEMVEIVKESWTEEAHNSALAVVNSFTRAARHFEADKRLVIEEFAGDLLQDWARN